MAQKTCPICKKPVVAAHAPFCSDRCRKVDLHRWMSEVYAVPTAEQVTEESDGDSDDESE